MAAKHPDYPVYWQSNTAFDSWVCQFMRISFSIFSRQKDDLSALSCWQRTNEGSKITRLRTFVSHLICEGMQRLHGSLSKWSLTLKPRLKHVTNTVRRKIIYHNISLWPGLVRGLPWHWWVRSMTCKKVHSNHPTQQSTLAEIYLKQLAINKGPKIKRRDYSAGNHNWVVIMPNNYRWPNKSKEKLTGVVLSGTKCRRISHKHNRLQQ